VVVVVVAVAAVVVLVEPVLGEEFGVQLRLLRVELPFGAETTPADADREAKLVDCRPLVVVELAPLAPLATLATLRPLALLLPLDTSCNLVPPRLEFTVTELVPAGGRRIPLKLSWPAGLARLCCLLSLSACCFSVAELEFELEVEVDDKLELLFLSWPAGCPGRLAVAPVVLLLVALDRDVPGGRRSF